MVSIPVSLALPGKQGRGRRWGAREQEEGCRLESSFEGVVCSLRRGLQLRTRWRPAPGPRDGS